MLLNDLNPFIQGWVEIRVGEVLNFERRMNTTNYTHTHTHTSSEKSLTAELHVPSPQWRSIKLLQRELTKHMRT